MPLNFAVEKTAPGSKARASTFHTLHGEVRTPVFMPVGTQATVKAQTVESLKLAGSRMLLANTYHLLLRPGPEVFQRFGGIHRFMNWDGPVLTDSGGFQMFSLPHECVITEDGARFASYVDGKTHLLSPEFSIQMQKIIGSDVMMVLDHCVPATAPHDQAETAMKLTHRWARRSLVARGDSPQAIFGIVQGACHPDLREKSALHLSGLPFDGLAIGGLAVGETHRERYDMTRHVTDFMPEHLPRYLMGVGTPIDLLESVHRGVDMFDCIMPSQLAQRGVVFTSQGKLQLRRSVYKLSEEPIDRNCPCSACASYSRAYLHHLIKSEEVLGWHLLTVHNLTFYHRLMDEMRQAILRDRFLEYYEKQRLTLVRTDEENPSRPMKQKAAKVSQPDRLGDYEVHTSPLGFSSVRQISSGEVMHSVNRPGDEAEKLYVDQSCLSARLSDMAPATKELVIWDVGLGAATNAMAAVRCFERVCENGRNAVGPMRIVSFESDLDSLRLAARDPVRFPHLRHKAPHQFLKDGSWEHSTGLLRWELVEGDFLDTLGQAAVPDLIFYDPFSFKTDSALWTPKAFAKVFGSCGSHPTELYTYSCATSVRVALLASGYFVAEGVSSGPKTSTTIAFQNAAAAAAHQLAPRLLGPEWLVRWGRSYSKIPDGLPAEQIPAFEKLIQEHPQFREI